MSRPDLGAFAHGQFRTDYEVRVDTARLREQRLGRARRAMAEHGLDALLCWKDENVRYLTGLRAQIIAGKSALLNGCLLLPDRAPILLASGGEVQRARGVMPWIEEIHTIPIMESRGLVDGAVEFTLRPLLQRHALGRARLGLDESAYCLVQSLQRFLPSLELADGDAAMQDARLHKLPEEVALMEEASAIAEAATQTAIEAVRPGVREIEVVAEAMRTLFRLGGEYAHVMTPFVASGEHMAPPNRIASDKIIRDGDLVFIDIGAQWSGYFSDMGRTVVCGRPDARQREIYTAVRECLAAAVASLVPGRTTEEVGAAVRAAAATWGLEANFVSLFIGHGVGIGANEPPYIGEESPGAPTVTLEPNMTFAIEPLIWVPGIPGGGGVRLEDTVLVAPGEGRALTRLSFDDRLLVRSVPSRA